MERKQNRNHGKKPPRYQHKIEEHKRLWYIWNGVKKRCLFENDARYFQYGGRGIKLCEEWKESFDNFAEWALSNGYNDTLTIERIDVNGDYCPENCKWITLKEQAANKRDTIWIDYHGRRVQLMKLCEEKNLNYDPIHNRIMCLGWDAEKAIDTPIKTNEGSLRSRCIKHGVNYATVRDRIVKLGWPEEMALSVPTDRGRRDSTPILITNSVCAYCGKEFSKSNGIQRFCSAECRETAKKERRKNKQIVTF